jgi:DNA-binding CsgD family transcriptional regulator
VAGMAQRDGKAAGAAPSSRALADKLVPVAKEATALLAQRERRARELAESVAAVPEPTLPTSLQRVADKLAVTFDVELATIRIRASDDPREFHLVAAAGAPTDDIRRLARRPLTTPHLRAVLALGREHSLARELGLVWLHGAWLRDRSDILGLILVGSRTERRPTPKDLERLSLVADGLAKRVRATDRRTRQLRLLGVDIARLLLRPRLPGAEAAAVDTLRPRERAVLELYADGMTTREIADLLVISPHTVRTHVKLALRRLGVHSRQDAERLLREQRIHSLL